MKQLVVVGDIHLHPHKAFARGHGRWNSRFRATLGNLNTSLKAAYDLQCPWICPGDWVHTIGFAHNFVLNELIGLLNFWKDVEKWCVWGNHDARTAGASISREETVVDALARAVRSLNLLDQRRGCWCGTGNGLKIYGEGYQPRVEDLSISSDDGIGGPFDIGVYHQTVVGSRLPSGTCADWGLPKEWLFRNFQLSIVGDVHEPQIIGNVEGDRHILIPGSLEPHNFGDQSTRGWWTVGYPEHRGEQWSFGLTPAQSPLFITVEDGGGVRSDGNYYRVLTPTRPEDLPPDAIAVSAPPTTVSDRSIISSTQGVPGVLRAWVHYQQPPEGSSLDRVMEVGLGLLTEEGATALTPVLLRSVELRNFFCYESAHLDVTNAITLVLGEGRDYPSNGAGKTTLFESIYWCLFGRTTKGVSSDEIIRYGAGEASVELAIQGEGFTLYIRRTRQRGGSSVLDVLDGTGRKWGGTQKDVTTQLTKFLGLTPELYQSLAYFSQSKLVLFSQATDSERKEMLADLCGLDLYQKGAAAARAQATALQAEITAISAKISALNGVADEARIRLNAASIKSVEWKLEAEKKRAGLEELEKRLDAEIGMIDARWQDFNEKVSIYKIIKENRILEQRVVLEEEYRMKFSIELQNAKSEYASWRESQDTLPDHGVLMDQRQVVTQQLVDVQRRLNTLQRSVDQVVFQRDHLAEEIKALRGGSPECPTCKRPFDLSERQSRIEGMQHELEQLDYTVAHGKDKLEETTSEQVDLVRKDRMLSNLIAQTKDRQDRELEFNLRINGFERMLNSQVQEQVRIALDTKIKIFKARIEGRVRAASSFIAMKRERIAAAIFSNSREMERLKENPYERECATLQAALTSYENDLHRLAEEASQKQDSTALYLYWANGFGRSAIQSLLMDEIAAAFNRIRPKVFPILTNGVYDVQFSTQSSTRAGDVREKSDFVIRERGALVSYESLSGGQRRRVDLGVMLVLALSVADTRRVPGVLGVLILDEVFGFLDSDGVESLYSVLAEVHAHIPSIWAVTHNPGLQSLFEHTLLVKQDEQGVSTLHGGVHHASG